MRTAILLSGFMRTLWHNYKNQLDNLIVPNNADVFIFAGGDRRKVTGRFPNCSSVKTRTHTFKSPEENLIDIDERQYFTKNLGNYLKKISFIEDDQKSYSSEFEEITSTIPIIGEHRHYYIIDAYLRMKKCNEMRRQYEAEHGFKYDAIIRLRSDTFFSFTLDIQSYDFTGNNLFVIGYHPPYGQSDAFFMGSPAIMDTICSKFVHEYGAFRTCWPENHPNGNDAASDLMDFHSFLNKHNATRFLYNSNKMNFHGKPGHNQEKSNGRQSFRDPTQCNCCIDGGQNISGVSIPITYENEIAKQYGLTELKVMVL